MWRSGLVAAAASIAVCLPSLASAASDDEAVELGPVSPEEAASLLEAAGLGTAPPEFVDGLPRVGVDTEALGPGYWEGTVRVAGTLVGSFAEGSVAWVGGGEGIVAFTIGDSSLDGGMAYEESGTVAFRAAGRTVVREQNNHLDGTMGTAGNSIKITGEGITPDVKFRPTSVSCTSMSGGLIITLATNAASEGFATSLHGHFAATRVGDSVSSDADTSDVSEETTAILSELTDLSARVAAGGVDDLTEPLLEIMGRALELERRSRLATTCGAPGRLFASPFGSALIDLIHASASAAGSPLNATDLLALINGGLGLGVLGSGSTNPALASELEALLAAEAQRIVAEALAATPANLDVARTALVSAEIIGWSIELTDEDQAKLAEDA